VVLAGVSVLPVGRIVSLSCYRFGRRLIELIPSFRSNSMGLTYLIVEWRRVML
jgi:hypothetical protein